MTSAVIEARTGSGERASLHAYSAFEPYELVAYVEALAQHLPDVAITVERMSTAALIARLTQEHDEPQADMILGWADTAARAPGLERIALTSMASPKGFIRPTGFATAMVIDPLQVARLGIAPIRRWSDLTDPRLNGHIAFPDPAISGAGFLIVTTLLQFYGEEEGWALLEGICANVAERPASAWEPAALTGNGTIAVGLTVKIAATQRVGQQPRLCLVMPEEVVGIEAEVYGGLRATRHADAVQDVVDWISTPSARTLFAHHNKTDLSAVCANDFMIDAEHAVACRTRWLDTFAHIHA